MRKLLLLLVPAALFATDAAAPTIPGDLKANYLRARLKFEAAQHDLEAAYRPLEQICGTGRVAMNDYELSCLTLPEAPKPKPEPVKP